MWAVNLRVSSATSARADRRAGSRTGARSTSSGRPTKAIGNPSLPTSKKPIGPMPESVTSPAMTRLVEVPMTVIVPPMMIAKDSGMSSRDTDMR